MRYERFATDVAAAFDGYAAGLTSLYYESRLAGERVSPNVSMRLSAAVQGHQDAFMHRIHTLSLAYPDGGELVRQVGAIGYTASNQAMRRIRGMDIKAAFNVAPQGAMGGLLRRAQDKLEFTAKDTAGRTWKAPALVRVVARDFAYQSEIDWQARTVAETSDLAQITYLDPTHENHGLVVSLSGAHEKHPSLESVRKQIFHPNASAQLTHVHP